MPSDDEIKKILCEPGPSSWFKLALSTALNRDPVDAANDAELLAIVLAKRAESINAAGLAAVVINRAKR